MAIKTDDLQIKIELDAKQAHKLVKDLSSEFKDLDKQIDKTSKTSSGFSETFKKLSGSLTEVNQGLEIASKAWGGMQRTLSSTIGAFASFETSLVGVQKTTDLSVKETKNFGDNIADLSKKIPVTTKDLLNFSQAAGQLGVSGSENLLNFAETMAKVQTATNLTGEEAATTFTRILNVTGTAIDKIDEFSSVVVALGNNFAASESEIARMTNEVARSLGVMGASAEEAAALGTAMRSIGIRAELGGSSMGKLAREIDKAVREGGASLNQLASIAGVTGQEFEKTFNNNVTDGLVLFLKGLKNLEDQNISSSIALENFGLSGDEINKTIPPLAKNVGILEEALSLARAEMQNATALNSEASRAFDTTASAIQILKNSLDNLLVIVGRSFAPIFTSIVSILSTIVNAVASAVDVFEELILVLGVGGLAKAVILVSSNFKRFIAMLAVTKIGLFVKQFALMNIAMQGFAATSTITTGIVTLNFAAIRAGAALLLSSFKSLAIALLFNPFTLIVISAAALIKTVKDLQDQFGFLTDLYNVFIPKSDDVRKALKEQENQVGFLEKSYNFLKKTLIAVVGGTVGLIGQFANAFSGLPIIGGYLDGLAQRAEDFLERMKVVYSEIGQAQKKAADAVEDLQTNNASQNIDAMAKTIDKNTKEIVDLINSLSNQSDELEKEIKKTNLINLSSGSEIDILKISKQLRFEEFDLIRKKIASLAVESKLKQKAYNQLIRLKQATQDYYRLSQKQTGKEALSQEVENAESVRNSVGVLKGELKSLAGIEFDALAFENLPDRVKLYQQQLDIATKEKEVRSQIEKGGKSFDLEKQLKSIQNSKIEIDIEIGNQEKLIKKLNETGMDDNDKLDIYRKSLDIVEKEKTLRQEMAKLKLDRAPNEIIALYEQAIEQVESQEINLKTQIDLREQIAEQLEQAQLAEKINGIISAARGGADALATDIITTIGAAFGPIGTIVAGAVNLLRQGYQAMFDLAYELTIIGAELPMKILEGAVGLIEGFAKAVTELLSDPERLGELLAATMNIVPKILEAIIRALPGILIKLFDINFWVKLIVSFGKALIEALLDLFDAVWDFFTGNLADSVETAFVDGVKAAGDTIAGFANTLFSVITDTDRGGDDEAESAGTRAGNAMGRAFVNFFAQIWHTLLDGLESLWELIKEFFTSIGGSLLQAAKDMWDFLMKMPKELWDAVVRFFEDFPEQLLKAIGDFAEQIWELFQDAFSGVGEFFSKAFKDIFGPLWEGFTKAFSGIGKFLLNALEGLWEGLRDGISNLLSIPSSEGKVEKWMKVDIPVLKFAQGGVVPGSAPVKGDSLKNDNQLSLLSPGEWVLPRSITQDKDKATQIQQVIQGNVPQFSTGWTKFRDKVTGTAKQLNPLELAKQAFGKLSGTLKAVFNWVKDNIGSVDIIKFVENPVKAVMKMVENGMEGFFKPASEGIMKSMASMVSFHSGGFVGNDGPANLQNGEFVMRQSAVNQIGLSNLMAMNSGSTGGQNTVNDIKVNLTVNTTQPMDDNFIRRNLVPAMRSELKEASLRGDFVLSTRGIR